MKLILKFLFSRPRIWKPYAKLLTKLVAFCSILQAMQATNAHAKANANIATKKLYIIPIASISHTSDGNNHRT